MTPIYESGSSSLNGSSKGRDFDYQANYSRGGKEKPRRSRPKYSRQGKAPAMYNGIHRRRKRKISW